eukprot:1189927-Prorocentrum_minimum.AAC.3
MVEQELNVPDYAEYAKGMTRNHANVSGHAGVWYEGICTQLRRSCGSGSQHPSNLRAPLLNFKTPSIVVEGVKRGSRGGQEGVKRGSRGGQEGLPVEHACAASSQGGDCHDGLTVMTVVELAPVSKSRSGR